MPGLVPVAGTVTMNGNPVEGADVMFVPKEPTPNRRVAAAQTDAQGRFTLTTLNPQDGAAPGEYSVTIVKWELDGPERAPRYDRDGEIIPEFRTSSNVLPSRYESPDKTPLVITVPPRGDRNLVFNLD